MIVLVSLIVLLKGFHCFHDFSHGASLHPYSNDFSTCIFVNVNKFRLMWGYVYKCEVKDPFEANGTP